MTAEGGKYGLTSARCCDCSLRVLLMMGEGITRNMYSGLQKYKKPFVVASCWTVIDISSGMFMIGTEMTNMA